jgi:hypothetical protein
MGLDLPAPLPVKAFMDIGGAGHSSDAMAIWITQFVGREIRLLDYIEGVGITLEVFERVYGHHHPDYQSNAVNALSRARQIPDRYSDTKRERAGTNVVSLHRKH